MAIVFGSLEAREVLLRDRARRVGDTLYQSRVRDVDGTPLVEPKRYVAATWEPSDSSVGPEEWDDFHESGELGGPAIMRNGWQ